MRSESDQASWFYRRIYQFHDWVKDILKYLLGYIYYANMLLTYIMNLRLISSKGLISSKVVRSSCPKRFDVTTIKFILIWIPNSNQEIRLMKNTRKKNINWDWRTLKFQCSWHWSIKCGLAAPNRCNNCRILILQPTMIFFTMLDEQNVMNNENLTWVMLYYCSYISLR